LDQRPQQSHALCEDPARRPELTAGVDARPGSRRRQHLAVLDAPDQRDPAIMRSALVCFGVVAVAAIAQAQTLDRRGTRAVESQVANAYAANATEADFSEKRFVPPNGEVTWRGHATFTTIGFVLDYAEPAGRRVISDMT